MAASRPGGAALLASWMFSGVHGISLNTNLTKSEESPGTSCGCLPWGALYHWRKADCGDTFEVLATEMSGKSKKAALHMDHGCKLIYPNLVTSRCMKVINGATLMYPPNVDKLDFTWCYVLSACHSLNGGREISNSMAWKVCDPAKDKSHGDLHPTDLYEQIRFAQVTAEPNLIAMAAYPYLSQTWSDVASYFGDEGPEVSEKTRVKLDGVVKAGHPVMICDSLEFPGNGHPDACGPPYTNYIVVGKEVWYFPRFRPPVCKFNCAPTTPAPPPGYPKSVPPNSVMYEG